MNTRSLNQGALLTNDVAALVRPHWRRFLVQGMLMTALGILAIALPIVTTLTIDILLGCLLMTGGVWRAAALVRSFREPGNGWPLILAVFATAFGAMLAFAPLAGVITLTMLLVAFFVIEGFGKVIFAVDLRKHSHIWNWPLATGILDLFFAAFIFAGWPSSAAWALGLLVGINMMFFGVCLMLISLASR